MPKFASIRCVFQHKYITSAILSRSTNPLKIFYAIIFSAGFVEIAKKYRQQSDNIIYLDSLVTDLVNFAKRTLYKKVLLCMTELIAGF